MANEEFDVFLSHSSVDKPWVIQLKNDLQRYGLKVWLDQDEIRPGNSFVRDLEKGLEQSQAVAMIISPEARESGWVEEEYFLALSLTKERNRPLQLIPVLYKEATLPGFLSSRTWVDFRDETQYEQKVSDLVWGVTGEKPKQALSLSSRAMFQSAKEHLVLEAEIVHDEETNQYSAAIRAPGRGVVVPFILPATVSLEEDLRELRSGIARGLQQDKSLSTRGMERPQLFGEKLFQGLFHGRSLELYHKLRQELELSSLPHQRLIIKINATTYELAKLPWELLYDPSLKNFLAFDRHTAVTRFVSDYAERRLTTDREAWRILLVGHNPVGSLSLDIQNEMQTIKDVLQSEAPHVQLKIETLSSVSSEDFFETLRGFNPHILHIMGYGGAGRLLLGDPAIGPIGMRETYLALALKNIYSLRLVFLNTYEIDPNLSKENVETAYALSRAGVPAVVTNQFPALYDATREVANEFYRVLAGNLPIDEALLWGRRALLQGFRKLQNPTLEWATPILYLQAKDSLLFEPWLKQSFNTPPSPPLEGEPSVHPIGGPTGVGDESLQELLEQIESHKKQLRLHRRTLDKLREQQATFGLYTAPYILIQIEDEERTIATFQLELVELEERLQQAQTDSQKSSKPSANETPELRRWYEQAEQAISIKNWKRAGQLLDSILEKDGQYPNAARLHAFATRQSLLFSLYRSASQAYDSKDWVKAVDDFEEIQHQQPDYEDVSKKLARARQEMQADGLYDEGLTYIENKDWERATRVLSQIEPDEGHRRNLPDDLAYARAMRVYAQAVERAKIASDQDSDWQTVIDHLKPVVEKRASYRDAEKILQQTQQQARWLRLYREGEQKFNSEAWAEAIRIFESITREIEVYRDVDNLLKRAQLQKDLIERYERGCQYKMQERWREARIEFRDILNRDQNYKDVATLLVEVEQQIEWTERYEQAEQAYKNDRLGEAISTLAGLLQDVPAYRADQIRPRLAAWQKEARVRELYQTASKHMQPGGWQTAVATLEVLLQIQPEGYREAKIELQRAKQELDLETSYAHACQLIKEQQWAEAVSALREIRKTRRDYQDVTILIAEVEAQQQAAAEAERQTVLQEIDQHEAEKAWAEALKLLAKLRQQYPTDKLLEKREAETEQQRQWAEHYQTAQKAFESEKWGQAADLFSQLIQKAGVGYEDVSTRYETADRYQRRDKLYTQALEAQKMANFIEAEQALSQALELTPEDETLRQKLAEVQQQRRRHELFQQAQTAATEGHWDQAIEIYQQLLALDQNDAEARQQLEAARQARELAQLYTAAEEAETKENWTEAIDHYQAIIALAPDDKEVEVKLAQVETSRRLHNLYQLGQRAEDRQDFVHALEHYQAILEIDASFHDVAGRVKRLIGFLELEDLYLKAKIAFEAARYSEAEPLLQGIVEAEPGFKDAARLLAEAQYQVRAVALRQQAEAAAHDHSWPEAVRLFEELQRLVPEDLTVTELLAGARHEWQQDTLYKDGLAAIDRQAWDQAIDLLGRVEPNEGIRQQQPLELAYAQARQALTEAQQRLTAGDDPVRQWQIVIDDLAPLVDQAPDFRDAALLLQTAQQNINWAKLYAQTEQTIAIENWTNAIQTLEILLRENADYRDVSQKLLWARQQQQLAEHDERAQRYLQWESWAEARTEFRAIVQIDPHYRDATGQLQKIETKISLDKSFKQAMEAHGDNDRAEAIARLQEIVAIDPDYRQGEVKTLLETWTKEHEVRQAYRTAEAAMAEPKPEWSTAVTALKRLLTVEPDGFLDAKILLEKAQQEVALETLYIQAETEFRQQQWQPAISTLKEIQALRENYRDTTQLIKQAEEELLLQKQYQQAVQYQQSQEWERARAVLEEIRKLRPGYADVTELLETVKRQQLLTGWYKEARQAVETEQWSDALKTLDKIREMGEAGYKDVEMLYNLVSRNQKLATLYVEAAAALNISDLAVAQQKLEAISEIDSGYLDVQLKLAAVRRRQRLAKLYYEAQTAFQGKKWDKAASLYRQVVDMDPCYENAAQQLQQIEQQRKLAFLSQQAEQAMADENWLQAIQHYEALKTQGQDDAQVEVQLTQARRMRDLTAHYQSGIRFEREGLLAQALQEYQAASELDAAYRKVADKVETLKRLVEWEGWYQQALDACKNNDFVQGISILQKLNDAASDYKDVQKRLISSIEAHRDALLARYNRAQELKKEGKLKDARHELEVYQIEVDKSPWL